MDDVVSRVVKRYDKLYEEQATWRSSWQELADYVHPRKSNITEKTNPGGKQTDKLFDSTAIHSNELLAASMNSALTPSFAKWFSLKVRPEELMLDAAVRLWLEEVSLRIAMALAQSNFNAEIHETYLDLGAFGTGAIDVMEAPQKIIGFNGLICKAYSIGEYVVAENAVGQVDTVFRKFEISARAAYERWGNECSEKVQQDLINKPDDMVEILHGVYPATQPKFHRHESIYIEYKSKTLLSRKGFYEFPIMVPRWLKSSGECYGRGPGFTALPDIKTLNKAVELELRAWAKSIDPPLEVLDNGVSGSIKLTPSGINYVRQMGNIKPMEFNARFDVSQLKKDELKESIRKIFFSDQLQMKESPEMTAAEVYVRYELMQRVLGPTVGRLESELLTLLIERVYGIMSRAGVLPPAPPQLRGRDVHIEYEGPMARAQRSSELVAVQKTVQTALVLVQAGMPQVLDNFKPDDIIRFVANAAGMPQKLLADDREIRATRKIRADKQAKIEQEQALMNIAEGASKVAPLITAAQTGGQKQA